MSRTQSLKQLPTRSLGLIRNLDIDIQLERADGSEADGTVLWEILDGEAYDGPAVNGELSLHVASDAVYTGQGEQTCVLNSPFLNSSIREVIAANRTEALFTVWGAYVFRGKIDPNYDNFSTIKKLFGAQLLFHFDSAEVYLGESRDGFRLLRASGDLERSSDARKLLIAALITTECGTTGMSGY